MLRFGETKVTKERFCLDGQNVIIPTICILLTIIDNKKNN